MMSCLVPAQRFQDIRFVNGTFVAIQAPEYRIGCACHQMTSVQRSASRFSLYKHDHVREL
jgi:hypothetical protein